MLTNVLSAIQTVSLRRFFWVPKTSGLVVKIMIGINFGYALVLRPHVLKKIHIYLREYRYLRKQIYLRCHVNAFAYVSINTHEVNTAKFKV